MSLLWVQAAYLDDEGSGPYYHATEHEFEPGDHLVPPGKRKNPINYEHPQGEMWRNHRVWVTKKPENAAEWAGANDGGGRSPHVYEVKPHGVKAHEPTNYDALDSREPDDQYQARGATVVRRLDPAEWQKP